MPTGQNWINFFFINLAFIIYMIGLMYLKSIQEIKADWAKYRCNPLYMPLSDNIQKDFMFCVQNIQIATMGSMLKPITTIAGSLTDQMGGVVGQVNGIRGMIDFVRNSMTGIIGSIIGIFNNLVLEFQKTSITVKDMLNKNTGVIVTMLYILDGSMKSMRSLWNGPTGQTVKALGKCFHPDTKVQLLNGSVVSMSNLNLGDVLMNGSIVESTMKINNRTNPEPLYVIRGGGVNGENIYVTGSHLIFDESINSNSNSKQFTRVENYKSAILQTDVTTDWFSCLITSDNRIHIGNHTFWDWEDHEYYKN